MRPVNAALLATAAVGAAAAPADAATRLVIRGAGFGHGVGMSQYGAYGFALQGNDHRQILEHYYTESTIARLGSTPTVRVLLANERVVQVSGAVAAGERSLDRSRTYTVRPGGQGVVLRDGDDEITASVLRLEGDGALRTAGGTWRGALELRRAGAGVQVVNAVSLEDYVRGVVAKESPSSWPMAALRAQAVAARTYAITTSKRGNGFEHFRDVRSQVYGGVAAETPSTDAAVDSTRGQVVTHGGRPVTTYFFSTSGGRTENVENVFIGGTPQPWLRSVEDPHDDVSPRHRWRPVRMTTTEATRRLRGLVNGRFKRIEVLERGRSPRIVRAKIVGTRGTTETTGPVLRWRFGLDDTWAYFTTVRTYARSRRAQAGGAPDARAADARGTRQHEVVGSVRPARRGARVRLQQREDGRWRTVGRERLRRNGRFRVAAPEPGRFRVVYGRSVAGPSVRVG